MNPEINQASSPRMNPQMNGDQSAAALAFATQLQEQMMPDMPVEGSTGAEMAQGEEMVQEPENKENNEKESLKGEFEDFKKEVKEMIKSEIGGLTKEIKNALEEE